MSGDVFTIAANNYLSKALVALASHRDHNPGCDHHLVLCERPEAALTRGLPSWLHVRTMFDIDVPDPLQLAFGYDILELATSIKPFVFRRLFAEGADTVTYIDPDVLVLDELPGVRRTLDSDAVITPHVHSERGDGQFPCMAQVLRVGQFNYGYLSLRNTRNAGDFLAWWADKLLYQCLKHDGRGIFVDQSWGAAIVSLMSHVRVERTDGFHSAYWNLHEGDLSRGPDGWRVLGSPLRMFHFSGFDAGRPARLSRHTERFSPIKTGSPLAELSAMYAERVNANEREIGSGGARWSLACYANGSEITPADRIAYLALAPWDRPDDPFERRAVPGPVGACAGFREPYVKRTWEWLNNQDIAIYGAGMHTAWLAGLVDKLPYGPKVVAVLDDGPEKNMQHFGGIRTSKPEAHIGETNFDTVLVSSDIPAIAAVMRAKAEKLFKDKQILVVDLYKGCPGGPYV